MLRFADIGRVSIGKLHGEDTITPNIDLGVIATFSFDKFGSHPADGADFARASISLSSQLCRVAEISKFDLTFLINEDIVTLNISMDNVASM